ncbi:hypothetical protein H9S92_05310 [Lewinella lacunae]|uniref:Uncharacterized protein n=1 Tax=Neolewinella lacunae TaxID=1517758 RepID=A0A923T845_9BACT|nr:hypothetical protein [Neolewinella lacunae]
MRFFESITQTIVASRQYYEDENEYLIILRNQLSPQELIFLFYTALASYRSREDETNGLYSYFNKYSMVLNISETDLFDPTHQILYPSVIFPFLRTEAKLFKEKLFKLV